MNLGKLEKYSIMLCDYPIFSKNVCTEIIEKVLPDLELLTNRNIPNQVFILYCFILQYTLSTNSFCNFSVRDFKAATGIGSNYVVYALNYLKQYRYITSKPYLPVVLLERGSPVWVRRKKRFLNLINN